MEVVAKSMRRLIINADDYGLSTGCDQAIVDAMQVGAVTSTSVLMSERVPTVNAALWQQCGVHLRLTDGAPVLPASEIPSLVDRHGQFPRSQQGVAMRNVEPEEVRREWRAQIDRFMTAGIRPTHLDSHHHVHSLLNLERVYADLCVEYGCAGVPFTERQASDLRQRGVRCADYYETRWTDGDLGTLQCLLLQDFEKYETVHLMTHPGYVDDELRGKSSMVEVRAREFLILAGSQFRGWLAANGIETIGMSDLQTSIDPLAAVDILYLAYNRLEFTRASLTALRDNTDWSRVRNLWLFDDGSTDGTLDLLEDFAASCHVASYVVQTAHKSPVAIMNQFLSNTRHKPAPWFIKIDNDVVLPPGWLPDCLDVLRRNPHVDLLGIEAKHPVGAGPREPVETDHIGGVGLMRTAAFSELPVAAGRLGFSDWQIKHQVVKAWLNPALPVILLDRLPFAPWANLSAQYEAKNWQRPWRRYTEADKALWEWWTK